MSLPDFQTLMLPVLEVFSDGQDHTNREARDRVAERLQLSDAELAELLPSGTQQAFNNRVHWALWYLQRCGLTLRQRRGVHRITERGIEVIASKPVRVDLKFLAQFPEFKTIEIRSGERTTKGGSAADAEAGDDPRHEPVASSPLETPDARLARAYIDHREALEDDILQRLLGVSPLRFESIVIELLVAMGYGGSFADAAQRIGRTGDGGIDGIIKEDRLGLDAVYVQAKRWQGRVGRPDIQKFAGSLQGVRAKKGIFITTSDFSDEAKDYADRIETRIVLLDGDTLARYLFEFGVGVRQEQLYAVKRIDEDFFEQD